MQRNDPNRPPMGAGLLRLPPSELPTVKGRAERAMARAAAIPPVNRCGHLGPGTDAYLCAEHPAAGLMCDLCVWDHTARHSQEVEHRCDLCGLQGDTMASLIAVTPATPLLTQTPTGELSLFIGPVTVVCLGVCVPCAEAEGLPLEVAS